MLFGGCVILAVAELFLLSIIAITRYPVNQFVVPAAVAVYFSTIIYLNIQNQKELKQKKLEEKKD